ncbi:hypothetical protein M4578_24970 [Salipiger sp. P9]|uniref:hypothetical protein n=1 Tax=Salipiger pentaromativorans TaxID=2943193 RepID=UPI0021580774|nr:hypothetical protein [Salipiger pentaromativorans]MCR8551084.1 hypothetical protein [Salipiger pentaromativorans]
MIAPLAVCASMTAAQAECPTVEDLGFGIFVTYDDESVSRVTRIKDGAISEDLQFLDGSGDRLIYNLADGVIDVLSFELKKGVIVPSSGMQVKLSGGTVNVAAMPVGGQALFDFTRTRSGKEEVGNLLLEKAEATEVDIGGCVFVAHPLTLTETQTGYRKVTWSYWLPDFGFSVLRRIENEGEVFDYRAVGIDVQFPTM